MSDYVIEKPGKPAGSRIRFACPSCECVFTYPKAYLNLSSLGSDIQNSRCPCPNCGLIALGCRDAD